MRNLHRQLDINNIDFLDTNETLMLVRAYNKISNKTVAQCLLNLMKELSNPSDSPENQEEDESFDENE